MSTKSGNTTLQVGKFGLVGVLNTVIDYAIFIGITKVFSIPLNRVWVAKIISGTVAMINSFFFNQRWVFKAKGRDLWQAARFLVSTAVGVLVIQTGLTQFFSSNWQNLGNFGYSVLNTLGIIGVAPGIFTKAFVIKTVAFGMATVASLTWNFISYKFWVFRK
jgi:putative flippase GtrA